MSAVDRITESLEELMDEQLDSPLSSLDQKVQHEANSVLTTNVAWEIVNLGLKKERMYHIQLQTDTNEARGIQKTIRQLLDLSNELPMSEKDSVLSERAIAIFKDLEGSDIAILHASEKKISPARMAEIKAQIGSHNDRLKTELQTVFTTKIQVKINEVNSLLETLRNINKSFDRFITNLIAAQKKS